MDWRLDTPDEVAGVMRAQDALGGPESALIIANPVPEDEQLDPGVHARVLDEALRACEAAGVTGQGVTPFLLDHLVRHTDGASSRPIWRRCGATWRSRPGWRRPGPPGRDRAGRGAAGRR